MTSTLSDAAREVLLCADPAEKARLARDCAAAFASGALREIGRPGAPDRPARPAKPELRAPKHMPKRRAAGSAAGRIALYHALAHIELNAVDLAFDLVARFASPDLPWAFYEDWVKVGGEEAHHFTLLQSRLSAFGAAYGDLPAHDGLWEAAAATADDLAARLAVVPLVLEARGLDVTPDMISGLEAHGDADGAAVLKLIYEEEIRHVAAGRRWFEWLADARGLDAPALWGDLVQRRFKGVLKPPFNQQARDAAGFGTAWLEAAKPLMEEPRGAG
jgi:uncharacterized ferritin-like protein (DUF455 family)